MIKKKKNAFFNQTRLKREAWVMSDSGDRNLSLTPVMMAPLEQLRDTSRTDSSSALKTMTATRDLDSLDTGQQFFALRPSPRNGSPEVCSVMKVPRTPQRGSHAFSLSLSASDPRPALPPPLTTSESSPRPPSLSPLELRHLTPSDNSDDGGVRRSSLLVHLCPSVSDRAAAQTEGDRFSMTRVVQANMENMLNKWWHSYEMNWIWRLLVRKRAQVSWHSELFLSLKQPGQDKSASKPWNEFTEITTRWLINELDVWIEIHIPCFIMCHNALYFYSVHTEIIMHIMLKTCHLY